LDLRDLLVRTVYQEHLAKMEFKDLLGQWGRQELAD
jgi:hypothetical protein